MKDLVNLEKSLNDSKKINLLKLVRKKNPTKSDWPDMCDNVLELIYHSILIPPINKEPNSREIDRMKNILAKTISKPSEDIRTLNIETDIHYEFIETRGVYCEYKIPIGVRKTSRFLIPEAKVYLKGVHSVWREKEYENELIFDIRVNLYANKKFFNKCLRGK